MNQPRDIHRDAASPRELQHHAVAELGQKALEGCTFDELAEQALDDLTRCLGLRYVKLLELSADGTFLTMRAGRGWKPGLAGRATVPNDSGSQAGYSLMTSDTIVVRDFGSETRFAAPQLLHDHGIRCGASVIVGPLENPWGVLGVHESDTDRCAFDLYDIDFVRSVANILWLFLRNEAARQQADSRRREQRSLADAMPILFAVVDQDGRYEFVNEAYRDFGDPESLVGRRVADVVGPEVYASAEPHIRKAMSGQIARFETCLKPLDGSERDVLVTYAPRWNAEGGPAGLYAVIVDISDQKARQRAILERTRHYQAIADSIPYGIWTCDRHGKLTYVSQSFLDLIGMDFATARDFGWIESLIPEEAEDTRRDWLDCVASKDNWKREHRVKGHDGRTYDILAIARPVMDENGTLTSYVGLNLDMTEWKQREETLKLLARELDHRVKNAFSLVLTIARMAARSANDMGEFNSAFEGRLQALAAAHDLGAATEWRGMSLRDLLRSELAPYQDQEARIRVDGPELLISVDAIQPLALAVHELATNAAKYGALSHEDGRLGVTWKQSPSAGVFLQWDETGLSGVTPPSRAGFGTTVLERVLSAQLDAKIAMDFRPEGLSIRIHLPASCWNDAGQTRG